MTLLVHLIQVLSLYKKSLLICCKIYQGPGYISLSLKAKSALIRDHRDNLFGGELLFKFIRKTMYQNNLMNHVNETGSILINVIQSIYAISANLLIFYFLRSTKRFS